MHDTAYLAITYWKKVQNYLMETKSSVPSVSLGRWQFMHLQLCFKEAILKKSGHDRLCGHHCSTACLHNIRNAQGFSVAHEWNFVLKENNKFDILEQFLWIQRIQHFWNLIPKHTNSKHHPLIPLANRTLFTTKKTSATNRLCFLHIRPRLLPTCAGLLYGLFI
jgi:hypothetical protein